MPPEGTAAPAAPAQAPAPAPAAPNPLAGASTAQPLKPGKAIGLEGLVQGAMEAMEADMAPQAPAQAPPAPEPAPEAAEEADEYTQKYEPESDEPEPEPVSTKGTKEDPLGINDLKSDQFVKIRIDGQEAVVSVREMADGYLRTETFKGRMRQAERVTREAQEVVQQSERMRDTAMERMMGLMLNGDQLLQFVMGDAQTEAAFRDAATKYATRHMAWKKDPASRLRFESERERGRLEQERKQWEAQRASADKERQASEHTAARKAELEPGWQAGLREANWPDRKDPQFQAEVRARVLATVQQTGQPITAAQLKDCVVRAARFLGSPSETRKPAPAPQPTTPKPQPRNPSNGQYTKNPYRKGTPEHLLHGLKPPRF